MPGRTRRTIPDNQARWHAESAAASVIVVLNWTEERKRLVPTN